MINKSSTKKFINDFEMKIVNDSQISTNKLINDRSSMFTKKFINDSCLVQKNSSQKKFHQ